MTTVNVLRVFPNSESGGNPAPIVLNAGGMTDRQMQEVAQRYGLESGFVIPPESGSDADYQFRFFVPQHEMEMCGHATIGALWLMRDNGQLTSRDIRIDTVSGRVCARVPEAGPISISQPPGVCEPLSKRHSDSVLRILKIAPVQLILPDIVNASTSRTKTLIPLRSRDILDALDPDFDNIEAVCAETGSTGLYPFAPGDQPGLFHSRQFPRASGYREDAATGIAASALAFGCLRWKLVGRNDRVTVRQGEAMGCASEISLTFEINSGDLSACWIHGNCLDY